MSARIYLAVIAIIQGCASDGWHPKHYPVDVTYPSDLPDRHLAALRDAERLWEDAAGSDVFRLIEGTPRPGAINVSAGDAQGDEGMYDRLSDRVNVVLSENMHWQCYPTTHAHELGHALLGPEHDPDRSRIMHGGWTPERTVTKDDGEEVRWLMGLE